MSIHEKLLTIQSELKAPKGQYNSFGKYNYRSCEDILEAVKPLLVKAGVLMVIRDEIKPLGERYYVCSEICLTDGETEIRTTAYAREEETKKGMDGSQITGAASSYARKYALNGMFAIDDSKDSDSTNAGEVYACQQCGKEFKPLTDSNGQKWTAKQMYEAAKAASPDHVARCKECREDKNNA